MAIPREMPLVECRTRGGCARGAGGSPAWDCPYGRRGRPGGWTKPWAAAAPVKWLIRFPADVGSCGEAPQRMTTKTAQVSPEGDRVGPGFRPGPEVGWCNAGQTEISPIGLAQAQAEVIRQGHHPFIPRRRGRVRRRNAQISSRARGISGTSEIQPEMAVAGQSGERRKL